MWEHIFGSSRLNDRWLRELVDRLPVGVLVVRAEDEGPRGVALNRRAEELLECDIDALTLHGFDALPPPFRQEWPLLYRRITTDGQRHESPSRWDRTESGGAVRRWLTSACAIDHTTVVFTLVPDPEGAL